MITVGITEYGDAGKLQVFESPSLSPGIGEVRILQRAIGVNPLDIAQRSGAAQLPQLPSVLGLEGAGDVADVGQGVEGFSPGDRVAYIMGPVGAYAQERVLPASRLVKIPDGITYEQAAAVLFKGITAQYLLHTTYPVGPGTTMVLYGASGALGQLMAPWAKSLGATVIGVVSKASSAARAVEGGCDSVFIFDPELLAGQVAGVTDGAMADVVYDSVGRASFETSLDCLRPRGLMVSFGASTGVPDPVSVATLSAKGSLFLTRPSLAAHTADLHEYRDRAAHVWRAVESGTITPRVAESFPLSNAAKAHLAIETGSAHGAVVLLP